MPKPPKKPFKTKGKFDPNVPPKKRAKKFAPDFVPKKRRIEPEVAPEQARPKPKPAPKPEPKAAPAPEPEAPQVLPTFAELGLSEPVFAAISALGFETPTPIQAQAIPVLVSGRDLIGQAQTGTGKTAAFGIPVVERVNPADLTTQALVLAPTRELAVQVAEGIHAFARGSGLRVVPVYGGQPIDRQFRALRNGAHVVVGTPGRVLDHLRRGSLSFAGVRLCVLDEADEMLALGFAEDLDAILAELPEERQVAFFSATMPPRILTLTKQYLREPVHIHIAAKQRTLDTTNQTYYEVPQGKKLEALARVLDMETPGPTIVFCRTRQETADLSENLRLRGYNAEAIHGDMGQQERDRVMKRFREGHADLLIATDVAARGLDIETVTHVINYDIPWDVEQYIHRIGRTGRAGRSGDAITLVSGRERQALKNIERAIGSTIKPARIPTAADIAAHRRRKFMETVRELVATGEHEPQLAMVGELAEDLETADIAAAALHLLWNELHADKDAVADEMAHDFEQPESGMTRLFIGMGRQDYLRPADIVGAIANEAGLSGKAIGVIEIMDRAAFVEVPSAQAEMVVEALRGAKIRNRKPKVDIARVADPFR